MTVTKRRKYLIIMMIVYGYHVNIYILLIPYYLLLTVITALWALPTRRDPS